MPTLNEILNDINQQSSTAGRLGNRIRSITNPTTPVTGLGQAGGAATVAATGTDLTLEVELDRRARALADEIIRQRDAAARLASFGRIFTQFQEGDIVANQQETVTKGIFSGDIGSLTTFFTSSTQTSTQKRYHQLRPVLKRDIITRYSNPHRLQLDLRHNFLLHMDRDWGLVQRMKVAK